MSYSAHFRISFGGNFLSEDQSTVLDIWACNVNAIPATSGAFDEATYLAQMAPNLKAWFAAGQNKMSNLATLEYVKCNMVGANGRYSNATATHRFDFTPHAQGGAAPNNPEIISVATSWSTAKQRGPGSHGRIYLPNPTMGTGASQTISAADMSAAAAAGVALLKIINNGDPANNPIGGSSQLLIPVVASNVNSTNTDIIGVKVGSVKDVQRRRKNALKETYQNAVFLAVAT